MSTCLKNVCTFCELHLVLDTILFFFLDTDFLFRYTEFTVGTAVFFLDFWASVPNYRDKEVNAVTEVSVAPKQDLEGFAYEQIKTAIVKGIYPPGYQIVEELVADQLSMSRSPVRTAIKRLQTEGFLEKRTNRRVYVALGDHQRTVNTLYIRKALEGVAAYQAAMNRTEEDLEEIRRRISEMVQYYKDGDAFMQLRMGIEIHRTIYLISKNELLAQIGINALEQESVFSYRSLNNDAARADRSYHEHTAILNAIIEQKADLAEQKAREHVDRLIERVRYDDRPDASAENGLLLSL